MIVRNVYLILLLLPSITLAQLSPRVDVTPYPKEIQPGGYQTLFFNLSYFEESDSTNLELPSGWRLVTSRKQEKENKTVIMYTFSVDGATASGNHNLYFLVFRQGFKIAEEKIPITVSHVRKLEINPISLPEYVQEGNVLTIDYVIQNQGNTTEKLHVFTNYGEIKSGTDSLELAPFSSVTVSVRQRIPVTNNPTWKVNSDLILRSKSDPTPVYHFVSTPVYSTQQKKNDPYYRYPIQAGFAFLSFAINGVRRNTYQYLATGAGHIDTKNNHLLQFTVRGPNQIAFPTIGSYDEYNATWEYKKTTKVQVGDYTNRVNQLMEFSRFGRGARVDHSFSKKLSAGLFYQQARFFPTQRDISGGTLHYQVLPSLQLTFDVLSKQFIQNTNSNWQRANIIGTSSLFKKENFYIESQVSVSQSNTNIDIGLYNRLDYRLKKLSVFNETIYAGKNYFGFYTNSQLFINNLNYQLNSKLNIGVSSNITRLNPSLDVLVFNTSPFSSTNMVFLSYQPNYKQQLFVNYTIQEREDRQMPATFHFKEDFGNISYQLNTERWRLFAQGRYGNAQNLLLASDISSPKKSGSVLTRPSARVVKGIWLEGYFEYQRTNKFDANNITQNLYFYGGGIQANLYRKVSLMANYRSNYAPDELFQQRSFLDASLQVELNNHRLSITSGRVFVPVAGAQSQNTQFFQLRYTWRINAPFAKRKDLGQLRGRITGNDIQRDGLLVKLGPYRTVTDMNGYFTFQHIPPDAYFLSLEHSDQLIGYKPTIKTPHKVVIQPDTVYTMRLEMVKTGSVQGSVQVVKSKRNEEIEPTKEKPLLLAKLYNDKESHLTQVRKDNTFSFKEVTPGNWTVKVIVSTHTDKYEVLENDNPVYVEPEKEVGIDFSIRSLEKRIFFTGKDFFVTTKK